MQRSVLAVLLLAAILAGAVSLSFLLFRSESPGEPAAAVPASADAVLLVPSVATLLKDLAGTRMAPSAGEGGWDLLADVLSDLLSSRGIPFDPDPARLATTLRGAAALAWLPPERPGSPRQLILAFETHQRLGGMLAYVEESILPGLAGSGAVWGRRSHRGREYGTLRFPGSEASVCLASYHRIVLVTQSGEGMRRALSALTKQEASFLSNPVFRRVRRELRERSDLIAYASGDFLRRALGPDRPGDRSPVAWLRSLDVLASVQGAGVSVTVGNRGLFRERLRLLAPGISQTLPGQVFRGRPRALETALLLPPEFPLLLGASFSDPGAVWDRLPEWLGRALGRDPRRIRDRLDGIEQFLGVDIRKEILGAIGGEITMALGPPPERSFVVAMHPSDLPAARRWLTRLDGLARAAEAYRVEDSPGGPITTYEHPRLLPFRPSYAVTDSVLLLAGSPETLRRALDAAARPADADASSGRGRALGAERAHLIVAADSHKIVSWIRALAPEGAGESAEDPWLRRLRDALRDPTEPWPPFTASLRVIPDGLTGEIDAPISPVLLGALLLNAPARRTGPAQDPAQEETIQPAVAPDDTP